jgi:hypothetical protein
LRMFMRRGWKPPPHIYRRSETGGRKTPPIRRLRSGHGYCSIHLHQTGAIDPVIAGGFSVDLENLENKCDVWRRLGPFDERYEFEVSLLARDICDKSLKGRNPDQTRRLRRILAEADGEVHRRFSEPRFTDNRINRLRDMMAEYRLSYYGPRRHHFAPAPDRKRWWLWLDDVAANGGEERREDFGTVCPC